MLGFLDYSNTIGNIIISYTNKIINNSQIFCTLSQKGRFGGNEM